MAVEAKLRLDVRSFRTGSFFTWVSTGGSGWQGGQWGRVAAPALQEAVRSLSYSLERNREELELINPAS